ncbi:MAG: FAD/NAD(P)-binding protein, partial [Microbacterium sp.]
MTIDRSSAPSIAIIGASVRGTSLLERIIASAPELIAGPLDVHVVDPHPPGSGRIWREGQSPHLIMNTVAAQSTLFTDDSVQVSGPVVPGPSLAQWCLAVTADPSLVALPDEVRAEAARTIGHSNPSRLLYGHYLRWCFARIVNEAPAGLRVHVHAARAEALEPLPPGWRIPLDDGTVIETDAAILATGWPDVDDSARHPLIVAADNPIDQDLSTIAAGDVVAVQGLGMGFFDTLSQLTEQRGGSYVDLPDGEVRYDASGREPSIIAGSRRGMPYRAKPDFGAPPFFPEQRILRAALPALHARRPVDFARDVLPLIERDAAYDHIRALARLRPDAVRDPDALLRALVETDEPIHELTARHIGDPALRPDLAQATDPVAPGATGADIIAAVRRDAVEAALGLDSPLKLGLHSYAAARGAVIDLVAFGGLTPESFPAYRDFLATAASFGSGPPLRRARQLVAAHDAGIVRFASPGMTAGPSGDDVVVSAPGVARLTVDRLVQAWRPAPSALRTTEPLARRLLDNGSARAWRFPDGTASDALEVRPEDGAVIGADGLPTAGLFSVGVPHEDIRVFTIIAPV